MIDARYLPVIESNCLDDNAGFVPLLLAGRATRQHVLSLCANFRHAAIASLLMTGRTSSFLERLQRSASAYAHYLAQASREERVSESAPLSDAIAAGDFETAGAIARLSHHVWIEAEEYQEDFLFYEFLMQHGVGDAPHAEVLALLDRWQACLNGTRDFRLDLCRSLFERDAAAFGDALSLYLDGRRDHYLEQGELLPPEVYLTEAAVSIDGVSLVRLAERRGLRVDPGFEQIPDVVRQRAAPPASSETFTRLD